MLRGKIVDIINKEIYAGEIEIEDGRIKSISRIEDKPGLNFIMPGFVDSHVHIESSMLVPSQFARMAVVHGTVATVSDPHEIANVCGLEGVEYMIADGSTVPFKFNFGAPSCVPATVFETAGAVINADDIRKLISRPEIKYLSEMMNFPGVLFNDPEVMEKIKAAKENHKPVDGHAPGLRGDDAKKYIAAGISTDHECFTAEEALDKLANGMKIIIREGSAAKNFEALADLLHDHADMMMFCSDDKHPDSLELGHINQLCQRAVAKGIPVFNVLKAACINPVVHYKLDVGLLNIGDHADFIEVEDLENFKVLRTYIDGKLVAESGRSLITTTTAGVINNFSCQPCTAEDFQLQAINNNTIPVIEALDGQLITNRLDLSPRIENNYLVSDVENDILKIVVVNRYHQAVPAIAFIRNFNLKEGALASSVAHDSHNIVAVGTDDESLAKAINMIIGHKGGISFVSPDLQLSVPLPVAGLMSTDDGYQVARQYSFIDQAVKDAGCTLGSPFMTLSFMALLVIPRLKLSDKGLFDGSTFSFVKWG